MKDKPKSQKEKTDPKDVKIKEMIDTLQRVQADFENYKKRVDNDKVEFVKFANVRLITELLPILDSFELALQNNGKDEGLQLMHSQLKSILEGYGLKAIASKGEKFDPYKHEALMQEESDKEKGIVIEELQKGYTLGEKVIRHTKVKVSK